LPDWAFFVSTISRGVDYDLGVRQLPKQRNAKMTYGIKKASNAPSGTPSLLTTSGEWISARFVGVGSNHAAKQWKTEAAARRVAAIRGGAVFTITETMNY
jgi:hypothetical protein